MATDICVGVTKDEWRRLKPVRLRRAYPVFTLFKSSDGSYGDPRENSYATREEVDRYFEERSER